ncbi:MAG: heavy metal sensor histidine kinase [Thiobacillaceae bacterium]
MSRPLSLTNRIAMLFAGVVVVVLATLGIAIDRAVDAHFRDMDRQMLAGKVELVRNLLAKAGDRAALDALPQQLDDALVGHHGLSLAVLDAQGHIWFASREGPFPAGLIAQARRGPVALATWQEDGHRLRGMVTRVQTRAVGGSPYTVAVSYDIRHHDHFMAGFRRSLVLVMLIAAIATAALGWAVTRQGLKPLRRMGDTALSISAQRLDARLPEGGVAAELGQLAAAFNQMLARLQEAFQRLADYAADLAHELRTPVSNLMTQTQVVLAQPREAAAYRETLESGLEEYERLARMIDDMLWLAKADNRLLVPQRETIDLGAAARRVAEFYEAVAAEAGVEVAVAGSAHVTGDRLMLERSIANLLANAIRHTPRGSQVRIEVRESASAAHIAVVNPGPAIPPEHLPHVFERFYRVAPRQPADGAHTGLGLAIVKSIAEAHGGRVKVASVPGMTRFELSLPKSA